MTVVPAPPLAVEPATLASSHPQVGPSLLEPSHPAGAGKNAPQHAEGVEEYQEIADDEESADTMVRFMSLDPELRYVLSASSCTGVTPT
jgi:hypothetical protein